MSVLGLEQIVTSVSIAFSLICFAIIIMQHSSEEQRVGVTYTVFSLITCLGYCQILYSYASLPMLIFATKLKYLGTLSIVASLLLVFNYFHIKIPKWINILTVVILTLLCLMIFGFDAPSQFELSNPHSWLNFCRTWLFKSYKGVIRDGIPYLKKENAWGHALFIGICVFYAIVMTILFLHVFIKNKVMEIRNLVLLYFIFIIPTLCYLFEKVFIKIIGIESIPIVPLGIVISDIIFAYLIAIRKFCDVNMLASNVIFDMVNTPAFVLDRKYRLTNINDTALQMFPEMSMKMIGANAFISMPIVLSSAVQDLVVEENTLTYTIAQSNTSAYINSSYSINSFVPCGDKVFQPKICRIISANELHGFVVWLEDVTLLHSYKDKLENEVNKKTAQLLENAKKLRLMRDQMVFGFSSLAEHHDLSSKGHLHRTASYTQAIANELLNEKMFPAEVDNAFVERMFQVAPLHDIGKTYIDKEIFNKAGTLTDAEYELMKQHTTMGANFIDSVMGDNIDPLYVRMAHDVALYHHEWWDGTGYPMKIVGNQIPLSARIMAVADNYDALVTERPYKRPFSSEEAFAIIHKASGTHFDPVVVRAFESIRSKIESIKESIDRAEANYKEINPDII